MCVSDEHATTKQADASFPNPLDFLDDYGFSPARYPSVYWAAIDALSASALLTGFYVRPLVKMSILEGAHGCKLVRPPWERLVPESESMSLHLGGALSLPSGVQPEFGESASPDLVAAVRQCAYAGPDISDWRARQERLVSGIERDLRPFADAISSHMSGSAARLASHVNLAFMAAVVVAMRWPDHRCVFRWFYGHKIVGDIPDTGLFRPHLVDFAAPASVMQPSSNRVWNRSLTHKLRFAGAADELVAESRAVHAGVERATEKEITAGAVRGPFSASQLDKRFGADCWRAQRRFGVEQGLSADGSPKIRVIDNSAGNGANACSRRARMKRSPLSLSHTLRW